jgi:class 3 adenylate cyclase
MICDLVGSTALAARLDPEDMRAVIDAYHAACARITRTYDGFLAEFRGDGILAYFGYPIAHEDDAERTVRAALDIIAAVARLETHAAEPLAVRIGIATGLVVIGDLSREGALREHAVVGDTPNLAARLQALAEPGRSSSPPPRAGCSAVCSVCATSACTRSRVSPSRSRRGWWRACPILRAVSRRSARQV